MFSRNCSPQSDYGIIGMVEEGLDTRGHRYYIDNSEDFGIRNGSRK